MYGQWQHHSCGPREIDRANGTSVGSVRCLGNSEMAGEYRVAGETQKSRTATTQRVLTSDLSSQWSTVVMTSPTRRLDVGCRYHHH